MERKRLQTDMDEHRDLASRSWLKMESRISSGKRSKKSSVEFIFVIVGRRMIGRGMKYREGRRKRESGG